MSRSQPSLFARHDTFFGVCEALGQDFRFNANYLRLAVAVGLLLNPVATLASYIGLGVVIMISRWIAPSRPAKAVQSVALKAEAPASFNGDNDADTLELANAA